MTYLINNSVPDCLVEGFENVILSLSLPDLDDGHVLAAAIAAKMRPEDSERWLSLTVAASAG